MRDLQWYAFKDPNATNSNITVTSNVNETITNLEDFGTDTIISLDSWGLTCGGNAIIFLTILGFFVTFDDEYDF